MLKYFVDIVIFHIFIFRLISPYKYLFIVILVFI